MRRAQRESVGLVRFASLPTRGTSCTPPVVPLGVTRRVITGRSRPRSCSDRLSSARAVGFTSSLRNLPSARSNISSSGSASPHQQFTNHNLHRQHTRTLTTDASMSSPHSLHELTAEDNQGNTYDFSQLKGKVVLVVNVASKCGFTPQYKSLQALYDKFKDQGLEIVAFPCNQFGGQEPGSDAEIQEFCQKNYGVSFPVMKKIQVNGDDTHPVYQFLKNSKSGLLGLTRIKWNFEKFLVDKEGTVVDRYSSLTNPESLEGTIEKLLKA